MQKGVHYFVSLIDNLFIAGYQYKASLFLFLKFLPLFTFGCTGSLLLHVAELWQMGATLCCCAWASDCGGFSSCGAQALGAQPSVGVAYENRCGAQA